MNEHPMEVYEGETLPYINMIDIYDRSARTTIAKQM